MAGYMGISNPINVLADIGMYRGSLMRLEVDTVDEFGAILPLDTINVKFKICDLQDDEIVYLEKVGINSIEEEGVSQIEISSVDTENLPISKYRYIIEMNYETGNRSIGKGFLTVL